jgi:DNA helicase-2/ATP-dependent DNA helicase PcrA
MSMQLDLRPSQKEILKYQSGWMGISAVPGSGKTFTLSALAASLISQGLLQEDQEVLVVTLVNSAVDNFSRRVADFLKDIHLLPGMGYRVRTLHGLAHDIIRERPSLAGLTPDFTIVDEHDTEQILKGSIHSWINSHDADIQAFVDESAIGGYDLAAINKKFLPGALYEAANSFIRTAKDRQLTPEDLTIRLKDSPFPLALVEMCTQIYADYQRALLYRNSLDFDDLIRNALNMLQQDGQLTEKLRRQWPYILEDEAQDSSRLQEEILRLLAGENGNWVRVGDPNQAIYETFTTASPQYLRNFVNDPKVLSRDLPASGRSARGIIDLANHMIDWVRLEHPNPVARDALGLPHIQPVAPDDPSPNPPDELTKIQVITKVYSSEDELNAVAISAGKWIKDHPDRTCAVLAQQNKHMEALSEILKRRGVPFVELLRSTSSTRETAGRLTAVIRALVNPRNAMFVSDACKAWLQQRNHAEALSEQQIQACNLIRKVERVEDLFYPLELDRLELLEDDGVDVSVVNTLYEFRAQMQRWLPAVLLPVDQLLLTVSQDLFHEAADLALIHKLAAYLVQIGRLHSDWRLPEYVAELATFAGYQRKIIGFSDQEEGFDPKNYRGKLVLATLHKAKGLEWDKVYLTSVNNYDFPSGAAGDEFYSERWFLRGQMNLAAESLAELDALLHPERKYAPVWGDATVAERTRLIQERLRLLFVGITRAKSELVLTCNNGSRQKGQPAVAMAALKQYLDRLEGGKDD